jgi:CTP synthase
MQAGGLVASGMNPELGLVEMVELKGHPYFIGCQFHPELQSRPTRPHPLFAGFIAAAATRRAGRASAALGDTRATVSIG